MTEDETLIRLVRLTFKYDFIEAFLQLFQTHRNLLLSQSGCQSVMLVNDLEQPNVFMTLSRWQSKDHLEKYRQSKLFNSTWAKVKPWFDQPPEVQNLRQIDFPNSKFL